MQHIKDLNVERIRVITVAKVASSAFSHSLSDKYKTSHGHSLALLKKCLEEEENTLVISGIRNPLARNLSYFFQTYSDVGRNDVKCKSNKYKGEKCYVMEKDKILSLSTEEVVQKFFDQKWHNTFNDWFEEFFEITDIDVVSFDKESGYQLYSLDNNNWILFYTFEMFSKNKSKFERFFDIKRLEHTNNADKRIYGEVYRSVKASIKFPKPYKQKLLNTEIINRFYSKSDIQKFWAM
tara:strand:+ start:1301 stop:2011 length:711 start_codon:yes stop_codon:yes gene_type:complete